MTQATCRRMSLFGAYSAREMHHHHGGEHGRPVTRMVGSSHLNPQAGKREGKVQIGFETSQHRGGSGTEYSNSQDYDGPLIQTTLLKASLRASQCFSLVSAPGSCLSACLHFPQERIVSCRCKLNKLFLPLSCVVFFTATE